MRDVLRVQRSQWADLMGCGSASWGRTVALILGAEGSHQRGWGHPDLTQEPSIWTQCGEQTLEGQEEGQREKQGDQLRSNSSSGRRWRSGTLAWEQWGWWEGVRLWIDVEGRAVRICWQTTRGVQEKGKSQARGDLKKWYEWTYLQTRNRLTQSYNSSQRGNGGGIN